MKKIKKQVEQDMAEGYWESEDVREHGCSECPPYYNMYTLPFQTIPIGTYIRGPRYKYRLPIWKVDE